MSITIIWVLMYIKRYYPDEYLMNKKNMMFYFIVENFTCIYILIGNFANNKYTSDMFYIIMCLGIYPMLQSFGYIFIKKTRDPLEGVSKLDFVYVVSIS